jgi:hypothetical protein
MELGGPGEYSSGYMRKLFIPCHQLIYCCEFPTRPLEFIYIEYFYRYWDVCIKYVVFLLQKIWRGKQYPWVDMERKTLSDSLHGIFADIPGLLTGFQGVNHALPSNWSRNSFSSGYHRL